MLVKSVFTLIRLCLLPFFFKCKITEIESLWIKIRPRRLPRCVFIVFVAVVHHPTSCGAIENQALLPHLQTNVEDSLRCHPEGLITEFVRALEILENPGKFLKPWKSLETLEKPWNFFYEALENLRILLKKYIRQMVHFQGSTISI